MYLTRITAALGAAALALTLAACGSDSGDADAADTPAATGSAAAADDSIDIESASLTMTDPWVKAAEDGMTAVFGTLVNSGDTDITVTAATSDIANVMELHETTQAPDGSMAMRPKEGGFTVPAGGEHVLAPGGDHLMVMGLTRALEPGEMVTFKLEMADGSTTEIDATVKRFTGADEEYMGGDGAGDMDMDMGDDMNEGSDS